MMDLKELLVVIPHSGILVPEEISFGTLTGNFFELIKDVDWYTNWLYDFRGILNNTQIEFPYCSLILEANRDPNILEDSVPLFNRSGVPYYRAGLEPDIKKRKLLAQKYLVPFHQEIGETIVRENKGFMLDAHSTVTARGMGDNQIELMNYQIQNNTKVPFCPDIFIEVYAEELTRRLPEVKVTVNESRYHSVYGHVCGKHSINSQGRVANRVPAILQETNQKLYMDSDGKPNIEAIDTLRRAFAGALASMLKRVSRV